MLGRAGRGLTQALAWGGGGGQDGACWETPWKNFLIFGHEPRTNEAAESGEFPGVDRCGQRCGQNKTFFLGKCFILSTADQSRIPPGPQAADFHEMP